jgi:spermidine synthase
MTEERGPLPGWLAVALVVGTSAAVLVLEILAGRLLAPYVGVSLTTYTAIIGTVLAGIAAGAWLGGVAADRTDPRRLVPLLLVAGGALALAVIPTVRWLGDSVSPTAGGVLALTAVAFLPSATVLSAVPTAVVKLQLRDLRSTGSTVGRLSAAGTAGAIVATFLTGFVLVAVAPVTTLIVSVGILLVLAGLVLWAALPRAARRRAATPIGAMGVVALAALGAAWVGDGPCDTETAYYCVAIVDDDDRPTGRVLVLDDLRHSYVDLADPTHLDFWYTRRIAEVIAGAGPQGAADVVHVGGGAMTVPTWWQVTRPDSRQVVMEIDGDLVELVVDEFARAVGPGTGIAVVTGDARLAMADRPDDSADVVVGDAFGNRAVPWHLATREFVEHVDRVLRPGGTYVLNVIDGPRQAFLRAETATIRAVLPEVAVVLGPDPADGRQGNSVIVASDRPLDPAVLTADGGRILTGAALRDFVGDAQELTDGFAPVDQLLLR